MVDVDGGRTTEFLTEPLGFKTKLTVRSQQHEAVIKREWDECAKDVDMLLNAVKEKRDGLKN